MWILLLGTRNWHGRPTGDLAACVYCIHCMHSRTLPGFPVCTQAMIGTSAPSVVCPPSPRCTHAPTLSPVPNPIASPLLCAPLAPAATGPTADANRTARAPPAQVWTGCAAHCITSGFAAVIRAVTPSPFPWPTPVVGCLPQMPSG